MEWYNICCDNIGTKRDQILTHIFTDFDHFPPIFLDFILWLDFCDFSAQTISSVLRALFSHEFEETFTLSKFVLPNFVHFVQKVPPCTHLFFWLILQKGLFV